MSLVVVPADLLVRVRVRANQCDSYCTRYGNQFRSDIGNPAKTCSVSDTMKIKMLCRNPADYVRETKKDIVPMQRNYDPDLHPFETAREYTRATNAVKMERIFARPFICSLDGHRDSVQCLTKHTTQLSLLLSGSCDGEVTLLPMHRTISCSTRTLFRSKFGMWLNERARPPFQHTMDSCEVYVSCPMAMRFTPWETTN